jgi:hypothetical protein
MVEAIKPKRIGCCGTPCFISRKKRASVGEKSLRGAVRREKEGERMINGLSGLKVLADAWP